MMRIYNAAEGILKRCCFWGVNSCSAIYGTGVKPGWCIISGSVNSTSCLKCHSKENACFGGHESLTFFFNNHSHLTSTIWRSCYCLVRAPIQRDDIMCFFSGSSCSGPYPVDLESDWTNCVISKFNFANNTDLSGYMQLVNEHVNTKIKDSVFSFKSSSPKWTYNPADGASVIIENSFVMANGDFPTDNQVIKVKVHRVNSATTYTPFRRQPFHSECNSVSKRFSQSIPKIVPLVFIPDLIATVAFT